MGLCFGNDCPMGLSRYDFSELTSGVAIYGYD